MKPQAGEELGHHMDKMAGILVQPWNITDVTRFTSPKQEETELWKQLIFFPEKIILPFPSSQDLATQAAADITHALLHPQPAGPFCKVGNEQTIALKRLASIFEGAKRRKSKTIIAPTNGIENTTPQRVQTTVSPPSVAGTEAEQISLQPNTSLQSTPNSHRRQKTPARRIVTPQTPHVMVRGSARQQHNLSQDMMAETINQANHCFAISAQPTTQYSKKPRDNTKVILLPEMANAVICPETGKSLKHQELITKLRYKIKWMRSTANEINRLYNTNTIRFIRRYNIPKGRKVTCGSFVVDIKDHKEEKEHKINRWRRSNLISRRKIYSNRRFDNGKKSHQQCYFHLGCQIPCHRPRIFI
jgi:hypothetical protein